MEISQEILDNLVDTLSCPMCLQIPAAAIFQCQVGHTVCQNCRMKITECPICKAPMTNTKNFLAQELAQKVKICCKFAKFGCTQKLAAPEQVPHFNKCAFRPTVCGLPVGTRFTCGQEVKAGTGNFLNHVLHCHRVLTLNGPGPEYSVRQTIPIDIFKKDHKKLEPKDLPPVLHLKHSGRDFLVVTSTFTFTTPFWSLHLIDSELPEGPGNLITMTLQNPVTKVELSFKGPAHTIWNTTEEISRSGMGLGTPRNVLSAISEYNLTKQCTEWNLIVSFPNIGKTSQIAKPLPLAPKSESASSSPLPTSSPFKVLSPTGSCKLENLQEERPDVTKRIQPILPSAVPKAPNSGLSAASSVSSISELITNSFGGPKPTGVLSLAPAVSKIHSSGMSAASSVSSISNAVTNSVGGPKPKPTAVLSPAPAVSKARSSGMSAASSVSSISDAVTNSVGRSNSPVEWPYSAEPDKIINLAVRADFQKKIGGAVCIIQGKGKVSLYSTNMAPIKDSKVDNAVEFDAQNAIKAISCFKTFFTPGCTVYITCQSDISQANRNGAFTFIPVLHQQLNNISSSRGNVKFVFMDFDKNRLEAIAVETLLTKSIGICNGLLRKAGIHDISDPGGDW